MTKINKQIGSTVLGFIAGLIVGLGIAVVVAMVMTKSSIPFSNKQSKQGKISEPVGSQSFDPNKPLYGNREPAKEAAKAFEKEVDPKAEKPDEPKDGVKPKDETKKDAKTEVKKDLKPDDRAAADKQKKLDAAKDAVAKEAAVKKEKAEENWTYYIQTNALRDSAEAENARAKLALSGFEARVSEASSQGAPLYRVRLGPFSSIEAMNRVRAKLTDNGIDAAVVRVPK